AFRAALERNPAPAEIHYGLATVLLWAGQMQAALESYQTAFERDPHFALDRGECYDFIRYLDFEALPDFWQADALRLFGRAEIDRPRHGSAALSFLMAKPAFRTIRAAVAWGAPLAPIEIALQEVMRAPLLALLLRGALLASARFEPIL